MMDAPEGDASRMSSLTFTTLKTRPSFGASSSHSASSQSQVEMQGPLVTAPGPLTRKRTLSDGASVSVRQDEKREELASDVGDVAMIVTPIEEDAPALEIQQLPSLIYQGDASGRESGLSPVQESTAEGNGAGEHDHHVIAHNLSQEVELSSASALMMDAGKEEEDEGYWRRFYIVLSVLVLAGVISAVVVSIVNRSRDSRRYLRDV